MISWRNKEKYISNDRKYNESIGVGDSNPEPDQYVLGLPAPDPLLVRGTAPDPSIIKQK
jgi:hypothetical protein